MKNTSALKVNPLVGYDDSTLNWKRITDRKKTFDYPVDYWVAILGFDVEKKHVDFMGKWEPNSYCHYHRHLSPTTSIVLSGEHNVVETETAEKTHKIRTRGDIAITDAGDAHMEYGGTEGSLLLFSMDCDGGTVFEVLDKSNNVLVGLSFDDFITGNY
jgi:hypothetical protein